MSQKNGNELQAGAISTLTGSGLMLMSDFVGSQLSAATTLAGQAAPQFDVLNNGVTSGMFGLGVVMVGWGVTTLGQRLSPRGRVRAKYENPGWADWRQLRKHLSASSALRIARQTRASFQHIQWWSHPWYLRKLTPTEYGIYVGKSVVGPQYGRDLYVSHKDVVLIIAPPQSGKTAYLSGAIIDAPGAVVATSTKHDLYLHTHQLRRADGRPVHLFNPEGVGGLESTFRWDPVAGCTDPDTAQRRADALVQGTRAAAGVEHGGFFESQAAKVLRALLMAAALENKGMRQVAEWVANPGDSEPERVLRGHHDRVPGNWVSELGQVLRSSADKTRESIYLTISLATAFMSNPKVAEICTPGTGTSFDLGAFLAKRGTLYLLGEGKLIAPLVTALTTYLFDGAKQYASEQPDGRLDPSAMFALDEAALIVPVDLDRWVSDAGGRNITIMIAAQSLSQIYKTWGERGGETIKNNANLELYFGGMTVASDMEQISALCGKYKTPAVSETKGEGRGNSTTTSTTHLPTLTVDGLRELPEHHVLVLYRAARPTIARTTPVWKRPDVRRMRKAEKQMAKMRAKLPAQRPAEESAPAEVSQ